jgi:signal transduction histidine kinase
MANNRDPKVTEAEATQRLQQLAVVGELAVGTAHETRNLLTAIVGFAQVARRRANDPAYVARQLERIERESLACVELLERFLAPSRSVVARSEAVQICDVIAVVTDAARSQLELQRIELAIDIAPDLPAVRCSRDELTRVLLNVLSNALHATPEGGSIAIEASLTGDVLALSVTDSGPGVPADLEERIFEPFFTTKPIGQGTGVGLALCRTILAAAGSTIHVERAPGRGAKFVIRLPAAGER